MKRKLRLKLNKKAMLDDFFDLMFTILAAFFILMFMGLLVSTNHNAKVENTLTHLKSTNFVNDLIVKERETLESNGNVNLEKLDERTKNVRTYGVPKVPLDLNPGSDEPMWR